MRRVQLDQLTDNMILAKSIYHDGNLILAKGMDKLKDYVDKLEKYGIFSVYVKDDISVDIEVLDAIHYETREKCKRILNNCFNTIKNQGNLSDSIIDEMVVSILSDLFEKDDVIVSMADIGVKDDATLIHSVNTAVFSVLTGRRMNLSESELKSLCQFPWPGNVRQLKNVLERFQLLQNLGETLDDILSSEPWDFRSLQNIHVQELSASLYRSVKTPAWKSIQETLLQCGNNKTKAAARLGISRGSLCYQIKIHNQQLRNLEN